MGQVQKTNNFCQTFRKFEFESKFYFMIYDIVYSPYTSTNICLHDGKDDEEDYFR